MSYTTVWFWNAMTSISAGTVNTTCRGLFLHALEKAFAAGELNFFSAHRHLHEPAAFRRYLAPAWKVNCRVGGDVTIPTPHRPGRADSPHPVLHERVLLAVA